jgi:hypothetical protein
MGISSGTFIVLTTLALGLHELHFITLGVLEYKVKQWFSTFSGSSPDKMNILSFVPVTISYVANCPGNIYF